MLRPNKELEPYQSYDPQKLYDAIPGMSLAREVKANYSSYPIDKENPLFSEELVDISSYGIAGQNYYSRPNAATGEAVPAVPRSVLVRKSLAEKLSDINNTLADPIFAEFFGRNIELYAESGHRSPQLQAKLYEEIFPELISHANPETTLREREQMRDRLIAKPSSDPDHPSPHSTGGAIDVFLRFKQPTLDYVADMEVPMGHVDGETSERVFPDFFEAKYAGKLDKADQVAKINRRAFYAIMSGKVFGVDTDLQVNPTEWWHWSYGDQMWAKLRHKPAALYGASSSIGE